MRALTVVLHGGALYGANFVSILLGFVVYHVVRPAPQRVVQVPVALILSIIGFVLWYRVCERLPWAFLHLRAPGDFFWVYLMALVWNPLIFVPTHYFTQGYLTSFGNIAASWIFQLVVNVLVLSVVYAFSHKKRGI